MTAKEALLIIEYYSTVNEIGQDEMQLDFDNALSIVNQALTELEAIKSADGGAAMEELEMLREYYDEDGEDEATCDSWSIVNNYILKAQAQEQELREFKATIKELLDIPITVSTFNGTSLLVKTMNKLNKLVGDKDE